jgi:hypothetical protein
LPAITNKRFEFNRLRNDGGLNHSTEFTKVEKIDGLIYLQGIEGRRAFSCVIHEATGRMTVAISRDGLSVTVFGACTDTDI